MIKQKIDKLQFSEIVKQVSLNETDEQYNTSLKIDFLRNVTIDLIVPYLKYLCYQEKLKPEISLGNYDTVFNDVINDNNQIYQNNPDVIVLCLKIETLSQKLTRNFVQLSDSDINEESKRIMNYLDSILSSIKKNVNSTILVHNFEIPVYPGFGIYDYQHQNKQINTIRQLNQNLIEIIRKYDSAYIIDVDLLQSKIGYSNYIDNRYWHIGKAPFTKIACKTIAKEYIKFIRALKGKNKKCLVLDCDNTLWGGIIGEDGINHIQIGDTYPGSAYRDFQQSILNLYHKGIMLAVCSKNNEADVLEVFQENKNMVLKENHLLIKKINWRDKVTNLKEIADEIGIGLDSFVFVDDSAFEIQMVNQLLPEVQTIHLPEDASDFADILNSSGLFDSLTFSDEDRKRNEMYKAEVVRKSKKDSLQFASLENYYRFLEMEVLVNDADEFSIPRIAQLTQKTNQFNLTTKRYSESEINQFSKSPDSEVLYLSLKDQFGDYGIVGVAILLFDKRNITIDTFLLSCRIIGRGAEDVLLKACINCGNNRNADKIAGIYSKSKKNSQVESFYTDHLFNSLEMVEDNIKYSFSLDKKFPDFPDYFKSIKLNNIEQILIPNYT